MASAQAELIEQVQNGTSGTLANHTSAEMLLYRSHSFDGHFVPLAPRNIPAHGVARFTHLKGNQASKAALIYTFRNAAGLEAAVILGWIAPAIFNPCIASPNKVFGAIGPKAVIDKMTYDQIQVLMEKAGPSIEVCADGVCMHATILNNPIEKMADLLANFTYLCPP